MGSLSVPPSRFHNFELRYFCLQRKVIQRIGVVKRISLPQQSTCGFVNMKYIYGNLLPFRDNLLTEPKTVLRIITSRLTQMQEKIPCC